MNTGERKGAIRLGCAAIATVLGLLGGVTSAQAQVTTTVLGTVQDAQGGVLPGASVELISETRGTKSEPVFTNTSGDFVVPNVQPDRYTLEVTMPSFRTLRRTGLQIGSEPRVVIGVLTLDVGGTQEVVNVIAETPLVQAASGERSFAVDVVAVENLPLANRSFTSLASLAPGVDGTTRIGGGGDSNIVMDGVSTSSPGNNATMMTMNTEALSEVRVLTSGYQAEYGRASGLQVTAVTKSGTNRFRGSVYDIERNSDWNSNSRTAILNGDPKEVLRERDFGFSIGGPAGRPGGNNKLFFFFTHEMQPRTAGNDTVRFRLPTAPERAGDFSQSTDNNGNLYPYIKNPAVNATCSAAVQAGCFAADGVLGRIPASALYGPGLALLKMYPMPNITNVPTGQNYNYELTRPIEEAQGFRPVLRLDYQPTSKLRGTYRLAITGQNEDTFNGTLPGFNDTRMANPSISTHVASVNYTVSPTVFVEASYGRTRNELSGCGVGNGVSFCTSAFPIGPLANVENAGIGGIPLIYADARLVDPKHYSYGVFNELSPPWWDGSRVLLPPQFLFGTRVAGTLPANDIRGFYNTSLVQDLSGSVTVVVGRHSIKAGFFRLAQSQAQISGGAGVLANAQGGAVGTLSFAQDTPGTNPFDTSFGFANAAIGAYSSYQQNSRFIEYNAIIRNLDFYIQDNWKVTDRLTLDYGLRFVHQVPDHERFGDASNFLPELWNAGSAPALYMAGCANGAYPCTGANRQALNPMTGQFLGSGSAVAIGTVIPGTGDPLNGLRRHGDGIDKNGYIWPALVFSPRFGAAYDPTGTKRLVLRGTLGFFSDRTAAQLTRAAGTNPPIADTVVLRYGQLQNLGGSLAVRGAPTLGGAWEYEPDGLPTSIQWNGGVQVGLPYSLAADVSYVGQHAYNQPVGASINAVDFGIAFLPENADPTLTASATPGATARSVDELRSIRGYGNITQVQQVGWRTYHSMQFSLTRRFRNGLSFSVNDTWSLYDHQNTSLRFDHTPDGGIVPRGDQAEADRLLGTAVQVAHLMRANFVWDLPNVSSGGTPVTRVLAALANDWQFAGIWTGRTGAPYSVAYSYQSGGGNINLTGSPDYGARVSLIGDTGSGCSSDIYRQFNTAAFRGPEAGSLGLESSNSYLKGCFSSVLDLSVSRSFRFGGDRTLQFRADLFNAPNAAGITGRNTTMNLSNPLNPRTITNLPFDENGQLIDARSRPRGAGFGVANNYQAARAVQLQIRFSF